MYRSDAYGGKLRCCSQLTIFLEEKGDGCLGVRSPLLLSLEKVILPEQNQNHRLSSKSEGRDQFLRGKGDPVRSLPP
ncbi:hypothetical protein [Nostoc sp. CHAB 5715]|uniref:hypothetical protein n=1 Tax=Nostoc sp. CHAB 5715 TaxID=2780400 RepID=UPI001E53D1E5|nr:hypothetical protein [Nostoc sp. CHAB 5715]MCC5621377.1 hypothetical protein [Nostoc sp. CHAB 5715]